MWRMKIKDFTVAAVIIIGSIVANGSSYAVSLSPGSTPSDALGVDSLSVTFNGTTYTYDITFENIAYDILYQCNASFVCSNPPTFIGNENLANAVAGALASALNTLGVTGISGVSTSEQHPYADVLIPFELSPPGQASGTEYSAWDHFCSSLYNACDDVSKTIAAGTWQANWTGGPLLNDTNGGNPLGGTSDLTLFTPVTNTPLPAALPLFATGLGAMGLLGWRRKRKARAVA